MCTPPNNASDEEINKTIKRQLEPYGKSAVSYLPVAEAAYSMGRRRLATLILDREQHPGDQIPLLLKMNEEELALQKAINSEDAELMYYTLISLEARILHSQATKAQFDTFYRVVHSHLEAANLLKIYYRHKVTKEDRSILHNLLVYNKNYFEAASAALTQGFAQADPARKVHFLKEASALLAQGKDNSFIKSVTDDQVELLEIQKNLEVRCQTRRFFLDLSVSETLYELVLLAVDEPSDARWVEQEVAKIAKKLRVSDKIVWQVKIGVYAEKQQWHLLKQLANEKKSPVGYKPFARACKKAGRPDQEIAEYADKISDLEERLDLLMSLALWSRAMDVATKLRDPYKLQEIGNACGNPQLQSLIQERLSKL